MNNNLEQIKEYLEKQLNETNQSLKLWEVERKYKDGEKIYQKYLFRKEWLETQLDNINYPIEYKK